jgi:hypothetical protein
MSGMESTSFGLQDGRIAWQKATFHIKLVLKDPETRACVTKDQLRHVHCLREKNRGRSGYKGTGKEIGENGSGRGREGERKRGRGGEMEDIEAGLANLNLQDE